MLERNSIESTIHTEHSLDAKLHNLKENLQISEKKFIDKVMDHRMQGQLNHEYLTQEEKDKLEKNHFSKNKISMLS